jgi:hypothetical protein
LGGLAIKCLGTYWSGYETMQPGNMVINWPLILRWHLLIMGLSESAMCRKGGEEEESSYHLTVPSIGWAKTSNLRLCMAFSDRY